MSVGSASASTDTKRAVPRRQPWLDVKDESPEELPVASTALLAAGGAGNKIAGQAWACLATGAAEAEPVSPSVEAVGNSTVTTDEEEEEWIINARCGAILTVLTLCSGIPPPGEGDPSFASGGFRLAAGLARKKMRRSRPPIEPAARRIAPHTAPVSRSVFGQCPRKMGRSRPPI